MLDAGRDVYFLGVHVWPASVLENGPCAYVAPVPAKKKIQAICDKISEETSCRTTWRRRGGTSGPPQPDSDGAGRTTSDWVTSRQPGGWCSSTPADGSAGGCDGSIGQKGSGQRLSRHAALRSSTGWWNCPKRSVASLCGRKRLDLVGEPDAGDPPVRFEERGVEPVPSARMWVKRQSIGTVSPTTPPNPRHSSTRLSVVKVSHHSRVSHANTNRRQSLCAGRQHRYRSNYPRPIPDVQPLHPRRISHVRQVRLCGVPESASGLPKGHIPFHAPGDDFISPFKIIVGGKNFGCGSSREHAPIALAAAGIVAVVAEFYCAHFYRNAVNGGYLIPLESTAPFD